MLIDRRPWSALPPTRVQLAANSDWENAYEVPPSGADEWLAEHQGKVSLEVFFTESIFLGVHLTKLPPPTRPDFVRALLASLKNQTLAFARAFWRLPNGTPLLSPDPPRALEVGVVDAWQNNSPAVIWKAGERRPTLTRLTKPLREPHPTRIALEASFANETWIGRDVSTRTKDGYTLNEAELTRAATDFLT
ncbi:hypothetical protein [Actinomadura hibisca]|uniref:hypothetical protein n=1 Tax=Actinomadura hibisca TaxID=68565 RepID=UPI000ABE3DD0|nr:hypothetical protein [Actinomadura hibisca]